MLGLKDEYKDDRLFRTSVGLNPHHQADRYSIMHSGHLVRARHYVPFVMWLTQQFKKRDDGLKLMTSDVTYRVAGVCDASNAKL